ncbi:hypothetical protein KC19_9G059300 [Ceratodon purpureus]|uniref:Non-specific serine/threonine protein kinase n=1 Tax=Ceratodon purpureus TaxID=3225 RepID=A0A8T0GP50_CERPU|nr:hypothetical protein KC19_9G059300 [Ceratodon purpureus]
MTSGFCPRLKHIECLTRLILPLSLLNLVIQAVHGELHLPVQGTSSQLPLSSILKPNSPSLVSGNGTFTLGFFSSSNNPGRFGLGIWYNVQISAGNQTVVWMLQRNANLSDDASLGLSGSGVLQLIDTMNGNPQLLWTSGNNLPGAVLELQDDGNLVLRDATASVIWQSFDMPTDTLLPGQVLRAASNLSLVSWRGADDWAEGYYFCSWLPINGMIFLTLYWNGNSIDGWNHSSWSSNVTDNNGANVYPYVVDYPGSDTMYLAGGSFNGTFFVGNESTGTFHTVMSSVSHNQGLRRVTLDHNGVLRLYSWAYGNNENSWTVESIWPRHPCAVFAECGPYGVCSKVSEQQAYLGTCSCPDGFNYINQNDPLKGCKRKYPVLPDACALNVTKLEMRRAVVGYTDFPFASRLYPYVNTTDEQWCVSRCLNDCRCAGAVFWRGGARCYIKSEPLFNGGFQLDPSSSDIANHSSYLKVLNTSSLDSPSGHGRKPYVIIGASVAAGVVLVCVAMAFIGWMYWKQRHMTKLLPKFAQLGALDMCPRKFTYRELSVATKNFSQSELIGTGGMGSVYKGILRPTGAIVAVKCIRHEARGSEQVFLAEASSISQIRHRSLVQLRGWCIEDERLLLVYDYMPNGSLDHWLYDDRSEASKRGRQQRSGKLLSWSLRSSILTDIAAALTYLHEDWQQCVLHRDIKSGNVLLDAEFNAHLGDFGLARLIDHQKMEKTTLMAGTLGYMAPEMPYTGKATKETDVFSFGVLMLEVVCGKKPVDSASDLDSLENPEDIVLLHRVQRAHQEGNLLATVDPRLRITTLHSDRISESKLKRSESDDETETDFSSALCRRIEEEKKLEDEQQTIVLKLGLLCCLPHPSARPSMRLVHQILLTGDATAIPELPDTTQWTHLDILASFRIGFHPHSLGQESRSLSSTSSGAAFTLVNCQAHK